MIISLVGGYYVGQFSTQEDQVISTTTSIITATQTTTSTTTLTETVTHFNNTETVIRSVAVEEDFVLQMQLDKVNFQYEETITVWFTLNYTGESTINIEIPYGGFRIEVWNETRSLIGNMRALTGYRALTLSNGQGVTGNAIITNRGVSLDVDGQGGAVAEMTRLSKGGMYYIEGKVIIKISENFRVITTPPITISITDQ